MAGLSTPGAEEGCGLLRGDAVETAGDSTWRRNSGNIFNITAMGRLSQMLFNMIRGPCCYSTPFRGDTHKLFTQIYF